MREVADFRRKLAGNLIALKPQFNDSVIFVGVNAMPLADRRIA